jgi:DNA repair exonuclease SbcCD nuclease subunit
LVDFGAAWLYACQYIAQARPDFAICAGDLFNRFTINPVTFEQALRGLGLVREAGVPIVDIAGNHDRARYGEPRTWLQTLADQQLLTYLDLETGPEGVHLRQVLPGRHAGSFVEWHGCRIVGVRYLGASTERILEELEPQLATFGDDGAFTILVLHAGLEGIVPNFNAEITAAALERLQGPANYVALGHIHKYYAVGSIAFNGGSLETWALNEWGWNRGLLHVDVDTEQTPAVTVRLVDVPRRPFCIVRIDVDKYESPRALLGACWEQLQLERRRQTSERPVAIVSLYGRPRFDQADLPTNKLEEACRELLDPLVALVRENFESSAFVTEGSLESDAPIDRAALEQAILRARLALDERYAPNAAALAKLASELKERALRDPDGPGLLRAYREAMREIARLTSQDSTSQTVEAVR